MRRLVASVLCGVVILGSARHARAENEGYIGELAGFGILIIADVVVAVGAAATGIGSSVQATKDPPTRGWAIASLVMGSLAGLLGAITAGVMIDSDLELRRWPLGWSIVGLSLVASSVNITLGTINLSRIPAQPPPTGEELDDVPEWSRGPAPGISLSFAW